MSVFRLPDLGEGLHDAEIVSWQVAEGDEVAAGQTLVTVETDKAVVEVPAPNGGRIRVLHGAPGDHVEVGAPLVEFEDTARPDAGAVVGTLPRGEEAAPAAPKAAPPRPPAPAPAHPSSRIRATPAVRAMARRAGIDLAAIPGTGPEGSITAQDVTDASAHGGAPAAERLSGPRRAMARNMARAGDEIVPATVTEEVPVPRWNEETDVTVALIRAVCAGCRAEPALNAWFDGEALTRTLHDHIDIGIAMDTPEGLFVPVIRDAGSKDAAALRGELDALKRRVLDRTIAPDDLRGQTVTLSNFGLIAGRHAALVVAPPQVAILGAGGVAPRVVARDGKPVVCRTLPLSLTFDHRAVTGGEAARFLAAAIAALDQTD